MPLQFKNIAVGNLQDDVSGNNYAANKAVYILNLNNTLAQIFSDEAGATPIIQDGVNNVTGARGVFGFWVEAGDYFVQVGANKYRVSITGADYFNNRVDETVDLIVDTVAGRGAYYPVGSFEAGFTYTDINQVGTFGGTDYYIYTGGLTNLPHNVTAGTNPTLSSDYAQVFYGEIDNVQGLRDELNDRALYLTLAEAQAKTDLAAGQHVRLIDRDLGLFVVRPIGLVADGFSIIGLSNGLTLEYVQEGVINIRHLGAKGDGVTDDTPPIKAAIDLIPSLVGGHIHVPTGIYILDISTSIGDRNYALLLNKNNVTLSGCGDSTVLKLKDFADCTVLSLGQLGGANDIKVGLHLKDFVVDGNWDNQTWAGPTGLEDPSDNPDTGWVSGKQVYDQNGITGSLLSHCKFSNVKIINCAQDGFTIGSSSKCELLNVTIQDCGKGLFTAFLCQGIRVIGGYYDNPNTSPDLGVTKDFYNTSSSGYPSIGFAYAPNAVFTGYRSRCIVDGAIITVNNGDGTRGRGILQSWDGSDLIVLNTNIHNVTGSTCIELSSSSASIVSFIVDGNTLINEQDGWSNSISASNAKLIWSNNSVQSKGTGLTVLDAAVLNISDSSFDLTNSPASEDSVDIRSVGSGSITGVWSNRAVDFNGATINNMDWVGNDIPDRLNDGNVTFVTDTEITTKSQGRTGATIPANSTETLDITGFTGLSFDTQVKNFYANSLSVMSANIELSARVVATDTVRLYLRNNTASGVLVGGATWYADVVGLH